MDGDLAPAVKRPSETISVYATGHRHCETVCAAFAKGVDSRIVRNFTGLSPGPAAFYGFLRGPEKLLKQCQLEGRDWYYMDNGYLRAGHYDGYFRLTLNDYQHHGLGETDGKRFRALGIDIKPWQQGSHVLVCPPGDIMSTHRGFSAQGWLDAALEVLRENTDREIRVRHKGSDRPLAADLHDCHALVTALSNTATDALLAGVPVFCSHPCAAAEMGKLDLQDIEYPSYPSDRERWAGVLADNQWTLEEMARGVPWD